MSLFSLGATLAEMGQPFAACTAFEEAVPLLKEIDQEQLASQAVDMRKGLDQVLPNIPVSDHAAYDQRLSSFLEAKAAGQRQYLAGDPVGALRFWQLAMEQVEHLDRQSDMAALLGNIGSVKCRLGRLAEGADDFSRAMSLARGLGQTQGEATMLNNLGCVRLDMGELPIAVQLLKRAVELRKTLANEAETAESLGNLGVALARISERAKALNCLTESQALYRSSGNMAAANTLATLIPRVAAGDHLDDRRAWDLAAKPPGPKTFEDFSHDLQRANEAEKANDFAEAARLYEGLLRARLLDDHPSTRGELLVRLGFSYNRTGRTGDALMCYREAGRCAHESGDKVQEARALNNAGVLSPDTTLGLGLLRRAAALREHLPDKHELGETYLSMAQCEVGRRGNRTLAPVH